MDPEAGKRKAAYLSGGKVREATSRERKTRKIDHWQHAESLTNTQDKVDEGQQNKSQSQNLLNKGPRGSQLTQKVVNLWVGGTSHGQQSLLTQDVKASIALQVSEQKCTKAEILVLKMQEKIENAEDVINNLTKSLEEEEKTKNELMNEINTTGEVVAKITEYINYITDTLGRCQCHKDHLSDLYKNIILGQDEKLSGFNNREEMLQNRIENLQGEITNLNERAQQIYITSEHKLNEKDEKLLNMVVQCEAAQKKISDIYKEKEEIKFMLSTKEASNLDLEKKVSEYANEVQNLTDQLNNVTTSLESMKNEELRLKDDLHSKNREIEKMVADLEASIVKQRETSAEIASIKLTEIDREEKLKCVMEERENLTKSFDEIKEINRELTRQAEKLKDETSDSISGIKKRLEMAESEKFEILEERRAIIDEMEKKHESSVRTHVKNYETCLVEMKSLENHHQSEISRISDTSSNAISTVNAETSRLEKELAVLRQEKEGREVELRQVEDLLMKHTNSELQLRRKLEKCQNESAALVAMAATTAEYTKAQTAKNKEKARKINELEKELLKLQFGRKKFGPEDTDKSATAENSQHRGKEVPARKMAAAATYQKSILRRPSKSRKTRSSPPSPTLPVTDKKISFMYIDSSSDTSPVKLKSTSNINAFISNEDKMMGARKSFSQPLQASQPKGPSQTLGTESQTSGKRFFKSRNPNSQTK